MRFQCRWSARRRAAMSRGLLEGFPGLFRMEVDGTDFTGVLPGACEQAARILPRGAMVQPWCTRT